MSRCSTGIPARGKHQIAALVDKALERLRAEAGVAVVSSKCASTLCRMELSAPDPYAMQRFAAEFPFQLGWNATARLHNTPQPDGSLTTVVYLSRRGHRLPEARG